jgi:hypothetical protein
LPASRLFVGTGPSSYKKIIYRAAVSQKLRNTVLYHYEYNASENETSINIFSQERTAIYAYQGSKTVKFEVEMTVTRNKVGLLKKEEYKLWVIAGLLQ